MIRFGFRRRCGWCGVILRGWQLNLCRKCKRMAEGGGSADYGSGSRWMDEPDIAFWEL